MFRAGLVMTLLTLTFWGIVCLGAEKGENDLQKTFTKGHYADYVKQVDRLFFEEKDASLLEATQSDVLMQYMRSLNELSRTSEQEAFLEKVVATFPENWKVLRQVGICYLSTTDKRGFVIAGEFQRGTRNRRKQGGEFASCAERDRIRMLQLFVQCLPLLEKEKDTLRVGQFYLEFADILLNLREHRTSSWELQDLTDLTKLPDYNTTDPYGQPYNPKGAAVNEDGTPVLFSVPESFAAAKNDGERWRWCLAQAPKVNADVYVGKEEFDAQSAFQAEADFQLASFLWGQYGVHTLRSYSFFDLEMNNEDDAGEAVKREGGIFSLETLPDTDSIAKLATGIQRFTLPEEFNFVKIFQKLAEKPNLRQKTALESLARIMQNRRQFPRAAEYLRKWLETSSVSIPETIQEQTGLVVQEANKKSIQNQLDQIVGNWGRFESQPAQTPEAPTVTFRFRNAKEVTLTATRVDIEKLVADLREKIAEMTKKSPLNNQTYRTLWNNNGVVMNPEEIGNRLLYDEKGIAKKYLTRDIQTWKHALEPSEGHKDVSVDIPVPLKPGAYLVESQIIGGNRSAMLIWISDTVIVRKSIDNAIWYYLADAQTGKELPNVKLTAMGYRQEWDHEGANRRNPQITFQQKEVTAVTDKNGVWIANNGQLDPEYQWILTAVRPSEEKQDTNRIAAFLGFNINHVFCEMRYDELYDSIHVFPVTDRPIYRPSQKVNFKFWCARAKYELDGESVDGDSLFANCPVRLRISDPNGEEVLKMDVKTDSFGACSGSYDLPKDAKLGQYIIEFYHEPDGVLEREGCFGNAMFRVEEYKKPEFEVKIEAPKEPVMLGETIHATVEAKYFFGAPVTQGTAKIKVTRTSHNQRWFAPRRWDWLYGSGYWWTAYEANWLPGWSRWGCLPPIPTWRPWNRHESPEIILEKEVTLTEAMQGKIDVEFSTELAKAVHPDMDHNYTVSAEVTDQSRRMISGSGKVLVARNPFKVYAWADRGYYRVGDPIRMSFMARTLDGKPVQGAGVLRVLEMSYDKDGKASEKVLQTVEIAPNDEGKVEYSLKATQAGQFRIAYTLTDQAKHVIEGAQLLTVTGQGFDGADLRFSDLELIPDKAEYAPGETMKLMVNTNREGASVQLFVRCTNGVCMSPQLLHMTGKSQVIEVPIQTSDQPNIFIEAVTVANAQVYNETKEICVPPEKRVLTMEIVPDKTEYLPGEKAKAKIRLTTSDGKPFEGDTVVTVYDKSLEYISGGSNVADICPFFWSWKRHHNTNQWSSFMQCTGYNMTPRGEKDMEFLGAFGHLSDRKSAMFRSEGSSVTFGSMKLKKGSARMAPAPAPMAVAPMMMNSAMASDGAMMDMAVAEESMEVEAVAGAPTSPMAKMGEDNADKPGNTGAENGETGNLVQATVRSNFADLAFWVASLHTDKNGEASMEFPMPENLTTWKVCSWALGSGTRVGQAETEIITRKNLILRMQTPRFMTTSDEILLTANVHNYLSTEKKVTVAIQLPEGAPISLVEANTQRTVTIPANGEARVDWLVRANDEGDCKVQMSALTDEESDAMELSFPIQIHGMMKQDARSELVAANAEDGAAAVMKFTIPEARRPKDSRLEIRFSPTLAGAMIDALPYLADYPYGCTEQTLNRFLPTMLVQRSLVRLGLNLEDIRNKKANLNAQELGDSKERAAQWEKLQPKEFEPVFDEQKLADMVETGATRLVNMQCSDGGWGWFSGFGEYSSPYLTAYVTRGLLLALQNEVDIPEDSVKRGVSWLKNYQNEQLRLLKRGEAEKPEFPFKSMADNVDAFVFFTLAQAGELDDAAQRMSDYLYRDHVKLSNQSNALLGIAWFQREEKARVQEELKYLSQFVHLDAENQTAWLELPADCCWWNWYDNEIETQAMYLRLICLTSDAKQYTSEVAGLSHLDVAARLVKYLLNNRKNATYWNSTRDTSLVLEAMTQYLQTTNEMSANMTVEVWLDGKLVKGVEITPQNLFAIDNTFVLAGEEVTSGEHVVELRRKGTGALYANGYASYFTLENFIEKTGLEVKVDRKYYKLQRIEDATETRSGSRGQVLKETVEKYERIPLASDAEVQSGDLVEVELAFESKNDYSFILIEDMKPAGFETVDVRSGYNGNALRAYVEYRDNRVVFFAQQLSHGIHSVSYRMRAEMPGSVSALPTRVEAMYAPEIKANSDEMKIKTLDK